MERRRLHFWSRIHRLPTAFDGLLGLGGEGEPRIERPVYIFQLSRLVLGSFGVVLPMLSCLAGLFCCSFSGDGAGGADSSGEGSVASCLRCGSCSDAGTVIVRYCYLYLYVFQVEIWTPSLLGCLFPGCDGESVAPLHPFGINFSWISPYLGAGCSIVAGESAEMSSGCDLGDPVGGCTRAHCCSGLRTVV